jgi:hypothetical protein
MYPLLDSTTVSARSADTRRAAERARLARQVRARLEAADAPRRGVRAALGVSLVRMGLRLIHA